MNKCIVQEHEVEVSGYVRGYRIMKVYYDAETKEKVDWEYTTDLVITRNDTDYYEVPSFVDNEPYLIEDE